MDAPVWNQVRNSLDVHTCLVSTVKLTMRSHPQGLQGDGEALHVWELWWTEGVWLPGRGAWLGFLTLSRDPTSLPVTAVKVLLGIPGKGCKFYIRDIRYHWFSQWWGASQGTGSTPSWILTSLSRVSACLTHPIDTETRSILSQRQPFLIFGQLWLFKTNFSGKTKQNSSVLSTHSISFIPSRS